MNIFDYFADEEKDIETKLVELNQNYEIWTREQVFDRVKEVCDAILAHLKKQRMLLLNDINPEGSLKDIMPEARVDHAKVEEELGQLTQVHVDEPNYDEYLRNLLDTMRKHIEFSKRLYEGYQERVSKRELANLDMQFNNMILHSTDFNTLQAPQ